MDQWSRRIIGFGIHQGPVDGIAACRMFSQAISGSDLLWLNPLATVLIFLLPGALTLLHSAWATYEHHSGLPLDGHHNASRNRTSPLYNALTGNLGLHTAHHKRPGLHWSLLPELHAEIEGEIPDELILTKFW